MKIKCYKFFGVLKDITKLVGGAFSAFPQLKEGLCETVSREAFTILVVPKGWATHTLHLMETRPYLGRNMH